MMKALLYPVLTPKLIDISQFFNGTPTDSTFDLIDCSIGVKINQFSSFE